MTGPVPSETIAGLAAVREQLAEGLGGHFDRLRELGATIEPLLAARIGQLLPEDRLSQLRNRIFEWLTGDGAAFGYGFLAAPGVVGGLDRYLYWFQQDNAGPRRVQLNFDPADPDIYDYLSMGWYVAAEAERRPVLYGPYVDYSCSNHYVLTAVVPVVADQRFLGVAGSDLLVSRLEATVVPMLQAVPEETVIVNTERQVVMSNSARWIPGDRLAHHPLQHPEGFLVVHDLVPGVGWAIAAGPSTG